MQENSAFDEVLLEQLLKEKWPGNKLTTINELTNTLKNPSVADPLLLKYLNNRPGLKGFLQECI